MCLIAPEKFWGLQPSAHTYGQQCLPLTVKCSIASQWLYWLWQQNQRHLSCNSHCYFWFMQSYALGTRLVVACAENTPLRGTKLIWRVADKAHNSILIYYVFELNRFVRAVGYAFHLVLYPRKWVAFTRACEQCPCLSFSTLYNP